MVTISVCATAITHPVVGSIVDATTLARVSSVSVSRIATLGAYHRKTATHLKAMREGIERENEKMTQKINVKFLLFFF